MNIGFEVTAAKPKGLRAAEEQPAQIPMRPREIAKNPTKDQKRVRRAMQRKTAHSAGDVAEHDAVQAKDEFDSVHIEPGGGHHHHTPRTAMDYTAAMNDVGDCRLCGGDLVKQPTMKGDSTAVAKCADCGTEHHLQDAPARTGSLQALASSLSEKQWGQIERLAAVEEVEKSTCPDCGSKGWGTKAGQGHSSGSGGERGQYFDWHARCLDCGHHYRVPRHDSQFENGRPRDRYAALQRVAKYVWVPVANVGRYLTDMTHLSAIARRAHDVLGTTEENL